MIGLWEDQSGIGSCRLDVAAGEMTVMIRIFSFHGVKGILPVGFRLSQALSVSGGGDGVL